VFPVIVVDGNTATHYSAAVRLLGCVCQPYACHYRISTKSPICFCNSMQFHTIAWNASLFRKFDRDAWRNEYIGDSYDVTDLIISKIWKHIKNSLYHVQYKKRHHIVDNYFMGGDVGNISRSISFLKKYYSCFIISIFLFHCWQLFLKTSLSIHYIKILRPI